MFNDQRKYKAMPAKWLLLLILFFVGIVYLWYDIIYAIGRDRTGESQLRTFVLIFHAVCATPLLLLPPIQYSRRFRANWPHIHRRLGQVFLSFALIAAVGAIFLSLQFEEVGRRPPLFIFACLWIFFAAAAWLSAVRKRFDAHQHFVSLTYGVALGFVLVRVLGDLSGNLFHFITDDTVVGITREWLCFIIPLLVVEAIYSWYPQLKRR